MSKKLQALQRNSNPNTYYLVDIVLKPETWLLLLEETFRIQSLENFEFIIHKLIYSLTMAQLNIRPNP